MRISDREKEKIKMCITRELSAEPEVRRLVIFGSFLKSRDPEDIDLAVFQDSRGDYLTLALKYRRRIREVSRRIPVDVIPIRPTPPPAPFLTEIEKGEVIFER